LFWFCVCISLSLIDIASAEQTAVSHAALMNIINFDSTDNIEPAERYLLATALSTHPTEATLKHLLVCNAAICLLSLPSLSATLSQLTRYKKRLRGCSDISGWLGSRVVIVLDSDAVGTWFKSRPRRCLVTVLGKLFTPVVSLFTKQRNWYWPTGWDCNCGPGG